MHISKTRGTVKVRLIHRLVPNPYASRSSVTDRANSRIRKMRTSAIRNMEREKRALAARSSRKMVPKSGNGEKSW